MGERDELLDDETDVHVDDDDPNCFSFIVAPLYNTLELVALVFYEGRS